MASLRRVGNMIAQWFYRDTCHVRGEFTGANGSVGSIKFKGLATVTYVGEGVYDIKLLANDGTSALKGFHIKSVALVPVAPATTDGLSGPWAITTDTMNSAGVVRVTTKNEAFAAADIIGVCKVAIELSPEAAS
jgi:hypothetical protein